MIVYQVQVHLGALMQHALHELQYTTVRLIPLTTAAPVGAPRVLVFDIQGYCLVNDPIAPLAGSGNLFVEFLEYTGVNFERYRRLVYHDLRGRI